MAEIRKLTIIPKRQWTRWDLETMICGSLQAEFSDLVAETLPGIPKNEHGLVRDEDFNRCLSEGMKLFLDKYFGD